MRVALHTHGCRLNQSETDAMEAALVAAGHDIADGPEDAEVYVLNSCTITHQADADARASIRRAKRRNPAVRVLVTGCYANGDPEAVAAMDEVDGVLGNGEKDALTDALSRLKPAVAAPNAFVQVTALKKRTTFTALAAATPRRRTRSLLKVQDGCNYRCSFCIVPQVRGRSRSLTIEDVVAQARSLVDAGAPEIVLTGIHLGTYGRDLRPRVRLADLVAAILPVLGPKDTGTRLRLSSLDPHEVDDDLIALVAEHAPQVCRYFHLPVQSGDPQVLRAMRRGHTAEDFAALTAKLAAKIPGVGIGTDVIVGFPGETDAAFENTYALLRDAPVAYHHVFTYSIRKGTAAATMPDQVPPAVKAARNKALRELSHRQTEAFAAGFEGQSLDAVIERGRGAHPMALADNYVRVPLVEGRPSVGERTTVDIERRDDSRVGVGPA
ncbi:MAG: tRNA (N(6)-L-threonylcarbamoyladenosine(37)-C(2))-methylthiotransferase MtaB [Nannocystaceae bacterium]|nr:tRNA (N(6)-L-threonylcarbamoyladenosine(37)-C(2))-methylthiotransferase MtaB [bacterium]